jgi:hypothetical protein
MTEAEWPECDQPNRLPGHLRSGGGHARGCGAVDLILGKA